MKDPASTNKKTVTIALEDELASIRIAEDIALCVKIGDCIGLSGDLGAGKTTIARAIIRTIAANQALEVPSPTFTLVQQYDLRFSVGHMDLYRLSDPSEVDELGLDDILAGGIALIEWPEIALCELPDDMISLDLSGMESGRTLTITGHREFMQRFERSQLIRQFLNKQGMQGASRLFLQGDASARSYERIHLENKPDMILMDSPKMADGPAIKDGKTYSELARLAEDVTPFIAIAKLLKTCGLHPPEIKHYSLSDGIILLEDLGVEKPIDDQNVPIAERYEVAIDVLAHLHGQNITAKLDFGDDIRHIIPIYGADVMRMEVELLVEWYAPFVKDMELSETQKQQYFTIWADLFSQLDKFERSLVLRDYHSPNIIWRPDATGLDRVGIIDFQDALIGPSAYDVISLTQDARVDVSEKLEAQLLQRYISHRTKQNQAFNTEQFKTAYALMAAQRASKILGIFVRLYQRDNKPAYLAHIPRIENYLSRTIQHSALKPLRNWLLEVGIGLNESK